MKVNIRQAVNSDEPQFIDFTLKLSKFNRENHNTECTYDDYEVVIGALKQKAYETFNTRDENTLILMAESDGNPIAYALARIFEEDGTADNGVGRMGLLDELFIDSKARGFGLGQRLIDETIMWMKEKGITRIKLHVYSWNDNAKKLYELKGFKQYAISYQSFI